MATYFLMRPLWASPWYYGYYPSHFSPYNRSNSAGYARQTKSYQTNSVKSGTNAYQNKSPQKISSPNKGKTANRGINRSLTKPTATQKKFQANNKKIRSGGFGNSGKRTLSTKKSTRSSSLFGGSSFRSSKSSSRSFSFGGK